MTSANTTPTASATGYMGGPSGVVVDNNASATLYPQAESLYFTTLVANGTNPGICGVNNYRAVKLTQGGLK